jgi:outer membrane lipoprotein carrier protein
MRAFISFLIFAVAVTAQKPEDAMALLKRVEERYNSTKTLQASFTHVYTERNRPHPAKKGTLYLRKQPSSTRWDYTTPAGDFFLSEPKFTYDYEKATNTVTRTPYKETEDTRIPLSFLLGKLDFAKDFKEFRDRTASDGRIIEMLPRSDKVGFDKITILVAPDAAIRRVTVSSPGTSIEYTLEGEQRNIKLSDSLFKFQAPAGAKIADAR